MPLLKRFEGLQTIELKEFQKVKSGFGFQKDSEFTELFNFQLLKLIESGVAGRLKAKWYEGKKTVKENNADQAFSFGFVNVVFPLCALISGLALAAVVVCAERCSFMFVTRTEPFQDCG